MGSRSGRTIRVALLLAVAVGSGAVAGGGTFALWRQADFKTEESLKDLAAAESLISALSTMSLGEAIDRAALMTSAREPLYPYLLAATLGWGGGNYLAILLIQILLHAGTAYLTWRLGKRLLPDRWAHAAALLVAADPALSGLCGRPYAENLATFLMVLSFFFLVRARQRGSAVDLLGMGVTLGLLSLARAQGIGVTALAAAEVILWSWSAAIPTPDHLAVPMLGLHHSSHRPRMGAGAKRSGAAGGVKTLVRGGAALAAGWTLAVLPWLGLTYAMVGRPHLAPSRTWETIYGRAQAATNKLTPEMVAVFALDNYSTSLSHRLFPGGPHIKADRFVPECEAVVAVEGLTGEPRYKKLFFCIVRKYPLELMLLTLVAPLGFLSLEYEPARYLAREITLSWGIGGFNGVNLFLRVYGVLLFLAAVLGARVWLKSDRAEARAVAIWPIFYLVMHAVLCTIEGRYVVPAIPFLILVGMGGIRRFSVPLTPQSGRDSSGNR